MLAVISCRLLDAWMRAPLEVNVHSLSTLVISPWLQVRAEFLFFTSFFQPLYSSMRHSVSGLMRPGPWEQQIVACCESISKEGDLCADLITRFKMMTNRSFCGTTNPFDS